MSAHDGHEGTQREQAADIAGLKAEVRRIDGMLEHVDTAFDVHQGHLNRHGKELGCLQVSRAELVQRVGVLEEKERKGSERMARVEALAVSEAEAVRTELNPRVAKLEKAHMYAYGWLAGAAMVGSFVAFVAGNMLLHFLGLAK